MRRVLVLALLIAAPVLAAGKVRVRAHVTKSGKHVPSHVRTKANGTKADNFSTKGNFNPYTGKKGTK